MSPAPQTDITSGPTRAELLAAAGMEPGILGAILTAARTDLG